VVVFSGSLTFMMGLFTKPLSAIVETTSRESDEQRLAEVEPAFTVARLVFNAAYQRFHDYQKIHKTGPFFMRVDGLGIED
jgi:hypothetical protein